MPKDNIISLGIDPSLVGTGVIILQNGKILKQKLIKSKPNPSGKPKDEVLRIKKIVEELELIVGEHTPTIAVVEGMAFGVRNATALVQLAALNYFIRSMLMDYHVPFIIIAPTSLKKFATGSGASKKDVMLMEVFKRWDVTILDDNENDAYCMARVGEALLSPKMKLPEFQVEVLSLLKKQL